MITKIGPPKVAPLKPKGSPSVGIGLSKLRTAYQRVKNDSADDFFPDLIGFREFGINLEQNLQALLKDVRTYKPSANSTIEVPKSPYFNRWLFGKLVGICTPRDISS